VAQGSCVKSACLSGGTQLPCKTSSFPEITIPKMLCADAVVSHLSWAASQQTPSTQHEVLSWIPSPSCYQTASAWETLSDNSQSSPSWTFEPRSHETTMLCCCVTKFWVNLLYASGNHNNLLQHRKHSSFKSLLGTLIHVEVLGLFLSLFNIMISDSLCVWLFLILCWTLQFEA
jgi:hypothetical protein